MPSCLLVSASLAGCQGIQSALSPGGDQAGQISTIATLLFACAGIIFTAVFIFTLVAIWGPDSARQTLKSKPFVLGAGVVFPIVALTALLFYVFSTTDHFNQKGESFDGLTVEVVGERWWWRVYYLDGSGKILFETANELVIPVGRQAQILLKSADVIHSFWIPSLAGKVDMIPGRTNDLILRAEQEGIYRGQCAEYCGAQHAKMAFHVRAVSPGEYERWLAGQTQPARPSKDAWLVRGKDIFVRECGRCHRVRGTAADGSKGPDLTHVGSRLSLGAGILPNNIGTLGGWISSSQHLKPDNLMPSFSLSSRDLRAVSAYLESLK